MKFRTVQYADVTLPDGWHGHVFERSARPVLGSRICTMQLRAEDWRERWPQIMAEGFDPQSPHVIKTSPGGHVSRIGVPFPQGTLELICKQSRPRGIVDHVASVLLTSRAVLHFARGNLLLDSGVSTAIPLVVMHRRRRGLWRESLLVTEAVRGTVDLDRACLVELARLTGPALYRAKAELLRCLAQLAAGVLRLGLYHRDFKAPNILVTGLAGDGQRIGAVLIDLDGLRKGGSKSRTRAWQPIMRLNASLLDHPIVTRTDRLRLLQSMLWTLGEPASAAKGYWYMLDVWTQQFLRRQKAGSRGKLSGYR